VVLTAGLEMVLEALMEVEVVVAAGIAATECLLIVWTW